MFACTAGQVLGAIASKSRGGTFHYIRDEESLTIRFAEILAGLLSVVVRDLELVVSELPGHSKIIIQEKDEGDTAEHGRYRQRRQNGKVYITFGDLFGGEARKVIIRILLPAVHRGYRATVLTAQCLYRYLESFAYRSSYSLCLKLQVILVLS